MFREWRKPSKNAKSKWASRNRHLGKFVPADPYAGIEDRWVEHKERQEEEKTDSTDELTHSDRASTESKESEPPRIKEEKRSLLSALIRGGVPEFNAERQRQREQNENARIEQARVEEQRRLGLLYQRFVALRQAAMRTEGEGPFIAFINNHQVDKAFTEYLYQKACENGSTILQDIQAVFKSMALSSPCDSSACYDLAMFVYTKFSGKAAAEMLMEHEVKPDDERDALENIFAQGNQLSEAQKKHLLLMVANDRKIDSAREKTKEQKRANKQGKAKENRFVGLVTKAKLDDEYLLTMIEKMDPESAMIEELGRARSDEAKGGGLFSRPRSNKKIVFQAIKRLIENQQEGAIDILKKALGKEIRAKDGSEIVTKNSSLHKFFAAQRGVLECRQGAGYLGKLQDLYNAHTAQEPFWKRRW